MGWVQSACKRLGGAYQRQLKKGARNNLRDNCHFGLGRRLGFEALESRTLLSVIAHAQLTQIKPIAPRDTNATGTLPNALRAAYGLGTYTSGAIHGGISFAGVPADGRGQTIAIVDAYDDPTAFTDLNAFSSHFGLPTFNATGGPTFSKLTPTGQVVSSNISSPNYIPTDPTGGWEGEEALDIEWAHAIAPMANLILFEAPDAYTSDGYLYTAAQTAANTPGVVAVSMSWGGDESDLTQNEISTYDSKYFVTPTGHLGGSAAVGGTKLPGGVTFLNAAGDSGAYGNGTYAGDLMPTPQYPATSPNVVAVGGTTLTVNGSYSNYTYGGESAWGDGINSGTDGGSGGGISAVEKLPSYQSGIVKNYSTTNRTFPDVSMEADPATGVPVYDTFNNYTSSPWTTYVGGTSLSSPMWSGLIALVDQGRAMASLGSLTSTQTLTQIYGLPAADFHDITTGSTGPSPTYDAGPGYDLATGLGSPVANLLVPALVNYLPTVTGISPTFGPVAGGTTVTITGTNFTGATIVDFGSTPATNVKVVSATQITATSPAGTGTVYVTVSGPGGVSATSSASQFAYAPVPTITSVSPAAAPLAGGTTVTINGNWFTGATAVLFGTVSAAQYTVKSATQITATVPAATSAGTVDVTVVNANGTSAASSADQLTYDGQPTITSISPPSGKLAGGTTVTITGTNLAGATAVKFGSNAATIKSNTPTQIVVTTPAGTGTVDVTVTDPGGTSATVAADEFAYVGPPTVATAAGASPSAVTGLTTALSVLGDDVSGESTLTYTWAATKVPTGAAPPTLSANSTNASKQTTATFAQPGAYTFTVTIADASGQTATSSASVTVTSTATTIVVSPTTPTIYIDQSEQFTAKAYDQFGVALATQPTFTWSKSSGVGSITAGGLFSSPSATGSAVISASSGSLTGTTTATVVPPVPQIASVAAAPSPVSGTTSALSVQATDEHGPSNLTYTWTASSVPSGAAAPTFSVNGANAAQNTTVTFASAGTYGFTVTVTNALNLTATKSVTVKVNQTLTNIKASPASLTVAATSTQQFTVAGYDQFGAAMYYPPACTWTTTVGQISASGLLTAPAAAASGTVTATFGTLTAQAAVTVIVYPTSNAAYVLPDPHLPGMTSLFVYGTGASDTIVVNPASGTGVAKGSVTVLINGVPRGTFNPTGRIIIHGLAGNETIGVSPQVTLPAFIYCGSGNDVIWGGGGANVIVGGAGKNTLYGGAGRSVVIAGSGASMLSGGSGEALLIAGKTNYDANDAALLAILNEWNSSESYATRAADLQGPNQDPLAQNGSYYLNASTVHANGGVNHIAASRALAMFFQTNRDVVTGKVASEITVTIK